MSINTIIKKASNLLRLSSSDSIQSQYSNGDIVYCKNNVCVHTPSCYREEGGSIHHPGYMVVKCHTATDEKKTLNLSWIPNEKLKRNYDLIHEISSETEGGEIAEENTTLLVSKLNHLSTSSFNECDEQSIDSSILVETASEVDAADEPQCTSDSKFILPKSTEEGSSSGVYSSDDISDVSPGNQANKCQRKCNSGDVLFEGTQCVSSSESSSDADKQCALAATETSDYLITPGDPHSEDDVSMCSSSDMPSSPPPRYFSSKARDQWYDRSAESMAYSANLAFPESTSVLSLCPTPAEGSSPVRRPHKCSIFSVDLGQMRSLRLFFSDPDQTCGQLLIASRESQYKILHFHHGGLDKLASIFEDWNFLVGTKNGRANSSSKLSGLKQFSVCRPKINVSELHPEENSFNYLDTESWLTYFTPDGVIEEDLALRRSVFLGGIEPDLRSSVWPFLLHYYDFRTTFQQREEIKEQKCLFYDQIDVARSCILGEAKDAFWKNVQCTVEKDVVRTDRSNPCFAGIGNPNIEKMKKILLNFAYYNPEIGYTQGMSDILAPILSEVRNEADVFWCFVGMMSKTIFVTSPRDQDMEKNLNYLRELLKFIVPTFYDYVSQHEDGVDLLFCHRWILLCFKREFSENETLSMWEACWSNYQTDYFHLFLVVAIVTIYGNEVVQLKMKPDETLLYFTSLAYHMDGVLVLKKARGILHKFRSSPSIFCGLVGLCELCGPGMWDSGHAPTVVCTGHQDKPNPCEVSQCMVSNAKVVH